MTCREVAKMGAEVLTCRTVLQRLYHWQHSCSMSSFLDPAGLLP